MIENLKTQLFGIGDEPLGWQDVPNENYHSMPGISSSLLKWETPAHFASSVLTKKKPTPAMQFGTDVHAAILEDKLPALIENPTLKKHDDENERIKKIIACKESVFNHPDASRILQNGIAERAGFYRDVHTGILLKIKPDYMTEGYIADVKTCTCASDDTLPRIINDFGYHISASFYLDIYNAINNTAIDAFAFIFVETSPPFATNVVWADETLLSEGRLSYRKKIEKIKECYDKNHWPAYSTGIKFVSLPVWVKREVEE